MSKVTALLEEAILGAWERTRAPATVLAGIFPVSHKTISGILARHGIKTTLGRPPKKKPQSPAVAEGKAQ